MQNSNKRTSNLKPIRFGLIGEFQSGKSLLINCILQRPIATVGVGYATTHTVVNYRFATDEYVEYIDIKHDCHTLPINQIHKLDTATDILCIDIYLSNEILKSFILTDLPGFGANADDNNITRITLREIDFAILVASNDKALGADSSAYNDILNLYANKIPYYFVLNCRDTDKWRCDDWANEKIAKKDLELLDFYSPIKYPLREDRMNIVNLIWYWYSISNSKDELINRRNIHQALIDYEIDGEVKDEVGDASNFTLINRIFSMENRGFLELMSEIKKLKDEICPIGTIQAFAFDRVPDGWMLCDGRTLSQGDYPHLFDVIGYTFGKSSSNDFQIPDLRGRFIRGWDNMGVIDKDRKFGSAQDDAIQNHSHAVDSCSESGSHKHRVATNHYNRDYANTFFTTRTYKDACDYSSTSKDYDSGMSGAHTHNISIGDTKSSTSNNDVPLHVASETRPYNVSLLFCIKYI